MVQIIKHGEDRLGQFLVEGTIGDMRFIGKQKGQKRKMEYTFLPYDPNFRPAEAFGEEGIRELQQEVKKAWMIMKQPRVALKFRNNGRLDVDVCLIDEEPATGRQA